MAMIGMSGNWLARWWITVVAEVPSSVRSIMSTPQAPDRRRSASSNGVAAVAIEIEGAAARNESASSASAVTQATCAAARRANGPGAAVAAWVAVLVRLVVIGPASSIDPARRRAVSCGRQALSAQATPPQRHPST